MVQVCWAAWVKYIVIEGETVWREKGRDIGAVPRSSNVKDREAAAVCCSRRKLAAAEIRYVRVGSTNAFIAPLVDIRTGADAGPKSCRRDY